jgi:hypothetical protein
MLSVPQMLWLVKHARENDSRVLLVGDRAQHRSVERGDALRILEQSASVRYVELLQTQRQKVPALKAAIEDLKAGRLQAGWEKLEHFGVIKEVIDEVELRQRAVEQHLEALRVGKTSLMISPRHEEARKVGRNAGDEKVTLASGLPEQIEMPNVQEVKCAWSISDAEHLGPLADGANSPTRPGIVRRRFIGMARCQGM